MILHILSGLYGSLKDILYQFSINDLIEINIISFGIYFFLKWISLDTQKNLLIYCYTYLAILTFSYIAYLPVLQYTLFLFLPVAILIFIVLHQTILQRNFVTLKNLQSNNSINNKEIWEEIIIRTSLTALNKKKIAFF